MEALKKWIGSGHAGGDVPIGEKRLDNIRKAMQERHGSMKDVPTMDPRMQTGGPLLHWYPTLNTNLPRDSMETQGNTRRFMNFLVENGLDTAPPNEISMPDYLLDSLELPETEE